MTTIPKCWPGQTAVVIAAGPSLTSAQIESCRGRAKVIAINASYHDAPFADVLYSSDFGFWEREKNAPTFAGVRYAMNPVPSENGLHVVKNLGREGLSSDPTGLYNGWNSAYAAANLAVLFGVTKILLLGVDMQGTKHAFGRPAANGVPPSPWHKMIPAWARLAPLLEQAGVTVINCSPGSALTCFPMAEIEAALGVEAIA